MARKFKPMTRSIQNTHVAIKNLSATWEQYISARASYADARERFDEMTRRALENGSPEEFSRLQTAAQCTKQAYGNSMEAFKNAHFHYKATIRNLIQNKQL